MVSDRFRKLATGYAKPSSQLSLHWGSHHTFHIISQNLMEVVVDNSPGQDYQSFDPIVNSFVYRHSFTDRIITRIAYARFVVLSGAILLMILGFKNL